MLGFRVFGIVALVLYSFTAFGETIKIAQFNTWGVPVTVKDTFRYWEAMEALETRDPDLVFLQEVFSSKGKGAFHSERYPFEARGPRGFPKLISSGIRILSKFPIVASAQVSFCKCTGADCLSNKGAVLAILELPEGGRLNVVATHLDAGKQDSIRVSQMEQIKSLIQNYADLEAPLIVSGDFNFSDRSLGYEKMMELFEARDTWKDTHDSSEPGYTYDAYENRYAHDYSIQTHEPLMKDRIDYVLYRSGLKTGLSPTGSKIIFNQEPLYSDHYGIEAEFAIGDTASVSIPYTSR